MDVTIYLLGDHAVFATEVAASEDMPSLGPGCLRQLNGVRRRKNASFAHFINGPPDHCSPFTTQPPTSTFPEPVHSPISCICCGECFASPPCGFPRLALEHFWWPTAQRSLHLPRRSPQTSVSSSSCCEHCTAGTWRLACGVGLSPHHPAGEASALAWPAMGAVLCPLFPHVRPPALPTDHTSAMTRGPKKHLKRLNAPHHWMLAKMGGVYAPKPMSGPHKSRECLPLVLILRNRLKYALTRREAQAICMQKSVKVDGKVRTDMKFPAGFMDVISIPKAGDNFRLMYDVKGRFVLHAVNTKEAGYKLARVMRQEFTKKGIPVIVTHDGRTIRYVDPDIKVNDTVKVNLEDGKVTDFIKFEQGNTVIITAGRNRGRVGVLRHIERHPGSYDIVHVQDAAGKEFATRLHNAFMLGKGDNVDSTAVSLPRGKGIKLSIVEERDAARRV